LPVDSFGVVLAVLSLAGTFAVEPFPVDDLEDLPADFFLLPWSPSFVPL
jgi:hypothetical protein